MKYTLEQLMSHDPNNCNASSMIIYRYEIDWMEVSLTPCTCDYHYFLQDGGKEDEYKVKWGSVCQVVSGFYSNNEDDDDNYTQKEAETLFWAMIEIFSQNEDNVRLKWIEEKDEYNKNDFVITIHAHLFEKSGYIYNFGFKIREE